MEDEMNKKKRIYVDTSIVGAIADEETRRQQTKPFWDAVQRGEIVIIVSDVLKNEVDRAPKIVREFFASISESQTEPVNSTEESNTLATQYITENVVGKSSLDDCKHIAMATLAHADVLVSWNFKHIVNVDRIRGYNGVNMKLGYPCIEIRTPYEVIHDEN
jgi:predicted nucleic acid-binding protein